MKKNICYLSQTAIDVQSNMRVLESLLEFASSRGRAFEVVPNLFNRFGDIREILEASTEDLREQGLSEEHIAYLKLLMSFVKRYYRAALAVENETSLNTLQVKKHLLSKYNKLSREHLILIMFDVRGNYIKDTILAYGDTTSVLINFRALTEEVIRYDSYKVIVAHNHPSGISEPSIQDKVATEDLRNVLANISVQLLDHYVIGDNLIYSLENQAYI